MVLVKENAINALVDAVGVPWIIRQDDRAYTMVGFGEATPPRDIYIFWWWLPAVPATTTRKE